MGPLRRANPALCTIEHPDFGSLAEDEFRPETGRNRCAQAKMEVDMRKLIAGMKTSVDGKIEGPEHGADWVEAWSEDYCLTPQIDACLEEVRAPATSSIGPQYGMSRTSPSR